MTFEVPFPELITHDLQELGTVENNLVANPPYILFPDTSSEDYFSRTPIASTISKIVVSSKGQMNFLISGEWGMGKTKILKEIEKLLIKENISIVTFSPWKYTATGGKANSISRAFLVHLSEKFGKASEIERLYRSVTKDSERNIITQFLSWFLSVISFSLYITILILILSWLGKYFKFPYLYQVDPSNLLLKIKDSFSSTKDGAMFSNLLSLIALLALPKIIENFNKKIQHSGTEEALSSPEELEKVFKSLMRNSLRYPRMQKVVSIWENTFEDTFLSFLGRPFTEFFIYGFLLRNIKLNKLVVFIDDIDRCDPSEVKEFLTSMKTFLEHEKVYFVIAADMTQLRKLANQDEPDFLRKIIQLDWNVPYITDSEIKTLLTNLSISSNYLMEEKERENFAAICRIKPNPRKIKYYFRRLLFLLNLLYENEQTKSEYSLLISKFENKIFLLKFIMIAEIYLPFFDELRNLLTGDMTHFKSLEHANYGEFRSIVDKIIETQLGVVSNTKNQSVSELPVTENDEDKHSLVKKKAQIEEKCRQCWSVLTSPVKSHDTTQIQGGLMWYLQQVSIVEGKEVNTEAFIEHAGVNYDLAYGDLQADIEHSELMIQELLGFIRLAVKNSNEKTGAVEDIYKLRNRIRFCIEIQDKKEYNSLTSKLTLCESLIALFESVETATTTLITWTDENGFKEKFYKKAIKADNPNFWKNFLTGDVSLPHNFDKAEWLFSLFKKEEFYQLKSKNTLIGFLSESLPSGKNGSEYQTNYRALKLIGSLSLLQAESINPITITVFNRALLFLQGINKQENVEDYKFTADLLLSVVKNYESLVSDLILVLFDKQDFENLEVLVEQYLSDEISISSDDLKKMFEKDDLYSSNDEFYLFFNKCWKTSFLSKDNNLTIFLLEKVFLLFSESSVFSKKYKSVLLNRSPDLVSIYSLRRSYITSKISIARNFFTGTERSPLTNYITLLNSGGKNGKPKK